MKFYLSLIFVLFLTLQMSAQNWELGLNGGIANYQGDIVEPTYDIGNAQLAYGIFLQKNFSHQLGLRLGFNGGTLAADDRDYDRFSNGETIDPIDFETNFGQLHLRVDYNLMSKYQKYHDSDGNAIPENLVSEGETALYDKDGQLVGEDESKVRGWSPYVFAGPSITFLNSNMREDDISGLENYPIEQEEEIPGSAFSFMFGAGINFFLSEEIKLGVEANAVAPFTDYLDGVSEVRNSGDNDFMTMVLLKLSYAIQNNKNNMQQ